MPDFNMNRAGAGKQQRMESSEMEYDKAVAQLDRSLVSAVGNQERMKAVVDALWTHLSPQGVSWVGFYLPDDTGKELILGPRRDKPACSPIGLHGICGRAFLERRPILIEDVSTLGENYIACDPADRSEVVIPVLGADGKTWAVLDLDSHDVGFFTPADVAGLEQVLASAFPAA